MKTILAIALVAIVAAPSSRVRTRACPAGAPVVFTNVRVLSMDVPALRSSRAVVTSGGRITSIDAATTPAGGCTVDAHNGVLMPGLADMHAHTAESEFPLFLANGVTLVREMNGTPAMVALRGRIARGELIGPRLLVASPLLVGEKLQYRHRLITSPEDATAAAREAKASGYDYLKIYDGLTRAEYDAFVVAGRELGIPLDGHIPQDVGLARVVEAGQYLQHMDKIAFALSGHTSDSSKLPGLKAMFTGKHMWVTPTIASLAALDMARTTDYAARLAGPEMAYVDSGSLGWWKSLTGDRPPRPRSAFYQFEIEILKTLRETDTRFLLGTDAANPLMVAGFSVHDELDALVHDAGFTPFDALTLATRNVGVFIGDTTVGRIAVGARADLVLVSGDPLANMSLLRAPVGVMVAGRWFDRAQLDSMLVSVRRVR